MMRRMITSYAVRLTSTQSMRVVHTGVASSSISRQLVLRGGHNSGRGGSSNAYFQVTRGYSQAKPKDRTIFKLIKESLLVGALAGLSFFIWTNIEEVPYTNRKRLKVFTSSAEEVWLGRTYLSAREGGKSLKDVAAFDKRDRAILTLLEGRFKYLKRAGDPLHLPYLEWDVQVVVDPQIKALTTPGGKILITTGLINRLSQLYEEGSLEDPIKALEAVLALQMAHAILRHATEQRLLTIVIRTIELLPIDTNYLTQLTNYLVEHPFTRDQAEEADWVAMIILARACEDPSIIPKILRLLGDTDWVKVKDSIFASDVSPGDFRESLAQSKLEQVIQDWSPNYCRNRKKAPVKVTRFPKQTGGGSSSNSTSDTIKAELRRSEQWYTWMKEVEASKKATLKKA